MKKENKPIDTQSKLSRTVAVAYVLNDVYCNEGKNKYIKLNEIMDRVSAHLRSIDQSNDYDNQEKQKNYARQFRRYFIAIERGLVPLDNKPGRNGGYRLSKPIPELALFDEEEITMLSLTLPKSDLVERLKKMPNVGKKLNTALVKGAPSVKADVIYSLMDAIDAIDKHCKLKLIDYKKADGTIINDLIITPVAIRFFKGSYYVVAIPDIKKPEEPRFKDYRLERTTSRVLLETEAGEDYTQEEVDDYTDDGKEKVFGFYRNGQRTKYTIQVKNSQLQRLLNALDDKATEVSHDDKNTTVEVIAYGKSEIISYNYYLMEVKKEATIISERPAPKVK